MKILKKCVYLLILYLTFIFAKVEESNELALRTVVALSRLKAATSKCCVVFVVVFVF